MRWQTRSALLALLVASYASAADDTDSASGPPTFHSTVSEVQVTFVATDEHNHPLANLVKSDFAIVDNERVVRNFRSFTHSDETSLDVVALLDLSQSVAPRFRGAMNDVVQLVTREQPIANDNISVLSFGGPAQGSFGGTSSDMPPAILCSSGCRTSDSVNRLLAVKSSGTTPLYDALIFAADFISQHRRPGARPVLILFSDGNDTISLHSAREAMQAVLAVGALIYSVDMGKSGDPSAGSTFLQQISEGTGGRYFSAHCSQKDGAGAVLTAVLEDLRASYVVTYDLPSHEAGLHALRLLPTHNLNLTFHSRRGYYYEPSLR
jgi:VWFA-related protein